MTVGELSRRMSSRELAEWQQLDLIHADENLMAGLRREAEQGLIDRKAKRKRNRA